MNKKPLAERIIDAAHVGPPQELPRLFGDYILQGSTHWLTGPTGIGKSTVIYNVLVALAEGIETWGISCEKHKVLYVDTESGAYVRSVKLARIYGDKPITEGRLYFLPDAILFPSETPALENFIDEQKVSLIVFDTVRRCFQVNDENDNAEVYNKIVPTLDRLKALGIATLVTGHPCKAGGTSPRGAGAQDDAGDVNLTVTMHKGDVTDPSGIIALSVSKHRLLGFGVPTLYLRRTGDDQFKRVSVEAAGPATPEEPGKLKKCAAAMLGIITNESGKPPLHGELTKGLIAQGYTETTFKRAFKEMLGKQEIAKHSGGGYVLTGE